MEKLYTPRFYYMLCSYQAQYKNELELEVIELMNILQVKKSFRNPKTGYGLFKQKILTPEVEEIKKITNLNLTFLESQKIGKKVTHIRFEFTKKEKDLLDFISWLF